MRRVLETGEPVIGYEHVGRVRSAPHRETAHMLSFTRLEDDRGGPIGVYYTVVDMTERHRARQRLALLDRAGERIGSSLDITRTAQELADVAVPGWPTSSPWTCWSRCCGARSPPARSTGPDRAVPRRPAVGPRRGVPEAGSQRRAGGRLSGRVAPGGRAAWRTGRPVI